MTIDELIAATGLTANDEIPIWDAEATGEPTKKITAQQLASAIVALASLVTSVNGETGAVTLTAEDVNAKATQTAVADPTASGNAVAFIDSISQNAQGVIVPTKKTVPNASTMAPGLMSAADKVKLNGIPANLIEQLADKASAIVDTASGAIASFSDGAAVAAKDITIGIEPVQSGSGDPSPTNVRPISGWTGCEVANISDSEKQPYFAGLLNGTYGFVDLGTLNWAYESNNQLFYVLFPACKASTRNMVCGRFYTPYAYFSQLINATSGIHMDSNGNLYIKDPNYISASDFTAAMSGVYLIFELATPTTPTITKEQFELLLDKFGIGGCLISISWQSEAGTVYGGTLDVTTGLLTVTHGVIDIGTYGNIGGANGAFVLTNVPTKIGTFGVMSDVKADCYKTVTATYSSAVIKKDDYSVMQSSVSATELYVKDTRYSTYTEFKAANAGTKLYYPIATPQTYQLTPTEVTLLLGDNNVWADTGDSTVTYRADTKLYIQKINAPTDDDMIADAQIASGRYFIVGGNLYRSTTTIPAGDTINPGSNCILTNLADALNALNT